MQPRAMRDAGKLCGQLWIFLCVYAGRCDLRLFFPVQLLQVFQRAARSSRSEKMHLPIIGASFIPAVFSLMTPVFFQAIGNGKISLFLSVMRQIRCRFRFFWLLSLIDLRFTPGLHFRSGSAGRCHGNRALLQRKSKETLIKE